MPGGGTRDPVHPGRVGDRPLSHRPCHRPRRRLPHAALSWSSLAICAIFPIDLVTLAGADYGSGSSRDWAARGTLLLGVIAVLAISFERIHRANLIGMAYFPCSSCRGPRRAWA